MPTRNRPRFVARAVWYFLRQDHERRELIVVDDGEEPVVHLVPSDARIRYVHVQRQSLGAKRNIGCDLARGDLIALWDDDDWAGPTRLGEQAGAVTATDADACAYDDVLHYDIQRGEAWRYRVPSGAPNELRELLPGTLTYRRSVWAQHAFVEDELRSAEIPFPSGTAVTFVDDGAHIGLLHGGNHRARGPAGPAWRPAAIHDVLARFGHDRSFYAAVRHGRFEAKRRRPAGRTAVNVAVPAFVCDGYGSMGEYLALGMAKAGAEVHVRPLHLRRGGLTQAFLDLVDASRPHPDNPTLAMAWWGQPLDALGAGAELVVNTMWETTALPADWPARLERARLVIVPSTEVARVFRDAGVGPVVVVPQGIDPDRYPPIARQERRTITTLMVGVLVPRKNMFEGVAAWKRAFAGDPDARLVIKARFRWGAYEPDDPRISFVDTDELTPGIAHWYARADVLLALGSEGFGLPLVEGMATGLPVVALDAMGQADVLRDAAGMVLPVPAARWVPCSAPPFGACGERPVPAVDDVAERLVWVKEHREAAGAMGQRAAAWAARHRNVWDMGPRVLDEMERHLEPRRALRRHPVVLAIGSGADAAYAAHLAGAVPGVRVIQEVRDLHDALVLDVQCDASRPDDEAAVAIATEHARATSVPIVVTRHGEVARALACDAVADVIVAFDEAASARLRRWWPQTPVVCIDVLTDDSARQHADVWQSLSPARGGQTCLRPI